MNPTALARILIVDDEAANMQALCDTLHDKGYQTEGATNGEDALKALQETPFDLLLTDLMMPGMDGVALLAAALKIDPQLVGILMTGQGTVETAVSAMQAGALDYVLKPITLNAILPVLARALGVRRLRLENLDLRNTVAIHELNQAIAHTLEPTVLLDKIADATLAQFDADEVSIMLVAEDGESLVVDAVRGEGREALLGIRVQMGLGIAGRVALRREPLVLEGEVRDPGLAPPYPRAEIRSALCMPMITRGRLVGVINVNSVHRPRAFPLGQIRVLSIFTNAAAAGIETARMYEDLRKSESASMRAEQESRTQKERAEALLEAAPDPVVIVDHEGRITIVNARTEEVFGYSRAELLGQPLELLFPQRLHAAHVAERVPYQANPNARAMDAGRGLFARRRDGGEFAVEISLSPLATPEGTLIINTVRNVTEQKVNEEALRASEARFRSLTELSSDWYFEWDAELSIRYTSQGDGRLVGISAARVLGRKLWEMEITPLNFTWEQYRADLAARKPFRDIEYLRIGDDGKPYYLTLNGEPVFDAAGAFTGYRGVGKNITRRKQAEGRIKALNRVYAVLSGINTLIVRVRDRAELFDEACRIAVEHGRFRMAWIGVVDRNAMKIVPVASAGMKPEHMALIKDQISLAMDSPTAATLVARAVCEKKMFFSNDTQNDPAVRFRREHAERGTRSVVILPLMVAGEAIGVFALYTVEAGSFDEEELKLLTELAGDIAFAIDHIEKKEKLEYLAFYDLLTGLPNRTLFHDRLSHSLHARGGEMPFIAVVLLDLERFRHVNESLGRQAGDQLLRSLGERLLRANETAARIGPDTFAFMLRGAHTAGEVNRAVEAIVRTCFHEPFALGGEELSVACRAGVVVHPADGADADTLLRNAEAALHRSKRAGERIVFYAPKMTARVAEALAMESKLRHALERQEFVLHYQPKVNLADGRVTGVEALLRWQDPDQQNLVPPDRFIPILEETGLIVEVGLWAIGRALTDFGAWAAKGLAVPRVAVNVSAIQLQRKDFVDVVIDAVQRSGHAADGLELEITESMLMRDVDASIDKLSLLRRFGIQISMDDFGTGYSSLSYIARLPVDTVKIDRSFVNGMVGNAEYATIVGGIIALVHSLGRKVIAEGVETSEQAQRLTLLGCDEAQGYLFSRPVPAAQIEALMRSGGMLPAVLVQEIGQVRLKNYKLPY